MSPIPKIPLDPKALGLTDPFDFSETNVPDDTYLHNTLKAQYDIYIASSITTNLNTTNADPNTATTTATPSPLATHHLPHLLTNIHTTNPLLQMQHALTRHPAVKLPSSHPVHAVYVDEVEKSERIIGECISLINESIDGERERRERVRGGRERNEIEIEIKREEEVKMSEAEAERVEKEAEREMCRGWGKGMRRGFEAIGGDEDGDGDGGGNGSGSGSGCVEGQSGSDEAGGDERASQRDSGQALGEVGEDGETVEKTLGVDEKGKEKKGKDDTAFLETKLKELFASGVGEEPGPSEGEVAQNDDRHEKKEDEEVSVAAAKLKNLYAADVGEGSPLGEKKEAQDDKADGNEGERGD